MAIAIPAAELPAGVGVVMVGRDERRRLDTAGTGLRLIGRQDRRKSTFYKVGKTTVMAVPSLTVRASRDADVVEETRVVPRMMTRMLEQQQQDLVIRVGHLTRA